jgi:general stress protein YciG
LDERKVAISSHTRNIMEPFDNETKNPESAELQPDRPPVPPEAAVKPRSRRGFAAMDPKLVSEISRKGGKAAHAYGKAHEFTADEARAAGRKGGLASHEKRRRASEPAESGEKR